MKTKTLGVSELVGAVRHELERMRLSHEAQGLEPMFQLSTMELTVKFGVKQDTKTKGGFDLQVISLGGETTGSDEKIHEVKLTYRLLPRGLAKSVCVE